MQCVLTGNDSELWTKSRSREHICFALSVSFLFLSTSEMLPSSHGAQGKGEGETCQIQIALRSNYSLNIPFQGSYQSVVTLLLLLLFCPVVLPGFCRNVFFMIWQTYLILLVSCLITCSSFHLNILFQFWGRLLLITIVFSNILLKQLPVF